MKNSMSILLLAFSFCYPPDHEIHRVRMNYYIPSKKTDAPLNENQYVVFSGTYDEDKYSLVTKECRTHFYYLFQNLFEGKFSNHEGEEWYRFDSFLKRKKKYIEVENLIVIRTDFFLPIGYFQPLILEACIILLKEK
ncbi:MAG: hypothetical protein SFU98_05575 [Leptospiraceae bacterium]|nr:hypothetical protein [Leptospiraceae bacterium]